MIFAWKVLGSRPGKLSGVLKWRSDDRFGSCLISVRVRAEIDAHLPDDLAWSVAWQGTAVDRRR